MTALFVILCLLTTGFQDDNFQSYGLGALYQNPRDIPWLIEDIPDPARLDPPPFVDHSANMPPVRSQGGQGSCVAWATGYYYKTYQEWLERGWDVTDLKHIFSPAFIYNHINGGVDGGSYGSDAMKVIIDHGCSSWADFPYNQGNYTNWPAESAYYKGLAYCCQSGHWISVGTNIGIQTLKQHIADGDNAVLFIWCWDNFFNIGNFNNIYCVADVYGTNHGGHGVCIVGYDDSLITNDGMGACKIVNSWGTGWGANGYFWMSYEAVKSATTSQQWACYLTDIIHYTPITDVRFKIAHSKQQWIKIMTGIGSSSSPAWTRKFFDWYMPPTLARPFPTHNIVLDITDGGHYLDAYDINNVYLEVRDSLNDGVTGTIEHYGAVNRSWGAASRSFEVPQSIPEGGAPVRINLPLPTRKLHWQSFHRLPTNTGFTDLVGDMDSTALLWSFDNGVDFYRSSPAIGDVDNDGDLDVIISSNTNNTYAFYGANGDTIWTAPTGPAQASPCLGDFDNDGQMDVVVCTYNGTVYLLNGVDGSTIWSKNPSGSMLSSPALGDINGNGQLDIVAGCLDDRIYALNGQTGDTIWSYTTSDDINSSPALFDIDCDGRPEVVCSCVNGSLYALNAENGSLLWSFNAGGAVQGSPCLGDINNDNTVDVICAAQSIGVFAIAGINGDTVWFYPSTYCGGLSSPALGDIDGDNNLEVIIGFYNSITAINAEDGSLRWTVPKSNTVMISPALADVDGNGTNDVIISFNDTLYALSGDNGATLWFFQANSQITCSPSLGDIDDDGQLEIVFATHDQVYALNGVPTSIEEQISKRNGSHLLLSAYPNPCMNKTSLYYSLAQSSHVLICVYDASGRQIAIIVDEIQKSGEHNVSLNLKSLSNKPIASGVYFCCLKTDNTIAVQKLTVVR